MTIAERLEDLGERADGRNLNPERLGAALLDIGFADGRNRSMLSRIHTSTRGQSEVSPA